MSGKKETKERKLTPIGEAKWAHVHEPKEPFESKGEPKYQIDVVFDKSDEKWVAWAKDLSDKVKALPEQVDKKTGDKLAKQSPIKRELDAQDEPTGRFYVTFKTGSRFKPGVFDKAGKVVDSSVLIGNGSKVRVAYVENVYTAFGGGINLYLNAVQVVSLTEYSNHSAESYGFDIDSTEVSAEDIPF